ncbi:hypothetical protein [Rhizobium sp. LEGMi135b]
MGAWEFNPWDNDDAAGWFSKFLRGCDFQMLQKEFDDFSESDESKYDKIRAACYILQCLGNPYMMPGHNEMDVKELIERGILILSKMANPPDDSWTYLDMWGNEQGVKDSLESQIATLKLRLGEWK